MKKLMEEFKEFALTSNVLELAIAVIMGTAASKMVTALVESILVPLLGIVMGGTNFAGLSIMIGDASIMYGAFIQSVLDFLVIALCVFFMMKGVNSLNQKLNHKEEEEPAEEPELEETPQELLVEIRDLLKGKRE